jgi:hypothetical protein
MGVYSVEARLNGVKDGSRSESRWNFAAPDLVLL